MTEETKKEKREEVPCSSCKAIFLFAFGGLLVMMIAVFVLESGKEPIPGSTSGSEVVRSAH